LKGGNEYRSYPSYEESMKDYLAYLQGNPRYAKMFEPVTRGSLGTLADVIHHAGYSDDPLYTFRILAAAKDPIMKQALWQYRHWPPADTSL
jgi:flagellar protein FlgJ